MNRFTLSIIRACKSRKPDRFLTKVYKKYYIDSSNRDMKQCLSGAMFTIVSEYNLCNMQKYRDKLYEHTYYYDNFKIVHRNMLDTEYEALKYIIRYAEVEKIPDYIPAKRFRKLLYKS